MTGRRGRHALAHGLVLLGGSLVLAACHASLPGPAQSPAAVPSTLDTGTPARSNLAGLPVVAGGART